MSNTFRHLWALRWLATATALCLALTLGACVMPPMPASPPIEATAEPAETAAGAAQAMSPTPKPSPTACALPTIVPPTPPAVVPGYAQLDPATNLHMTGNPQQLDLATYRLTVGGRVRNPLRLTYDELRCLPKIELRCTLVCPGFFVDVATWAGASFESVLALAEVEPDATDVELVGADGYRTTLRLDQVRSGQSFLAYEWEGQPVPILHGFPVRAVFPELVGGHWVKWLTEINLR